MMVSLTPREIARKAAARWKMSARGKGNRWQMLRDIVAVCSIQPWTTTELEDLMLIMRGLQHKTTYQMILELQRSLCLEGIEEERGSYIRTTNHGVIVFLLAREHIPATIAEVALTFSAARKSEKTEKNSGV